MSKRSSFNDDPNMTDESSSLNGEPTLNDEDVSSTESIGLLPRAEWAEERPKGWKTTPLPWGQLLIVLMNWVCSSLAGQSMQPYVNQRVGELSIIGGDKRKVGYYVGLIDSFSQITLTVTTLPWNRLSDYWGRKSVLLIGILGLMVSQLCFALSQTYTGLIASACVWGLLDANVGVTKSIVGEITDSTNRARAFVLMNNSWAAGATIGPLIGGLLARPSDRFPMLFGGEFWKQYPYFLPSFTVAIIVAGSFVIAAVYFKETLVKPPGSSESISVDPGDQPLPLLQVFTYPVIIAISNYMSLAFLSACSGSLFPLVAAMPIDIGGLDLDPPRIGYILGFFNAITGVFSFLFFPTLTHRFGVRTIFVASMSSFPVFWVLFWAVSLSAKYYGVGKTVYMWIGAMLIPYIFIDLAYGCIYIIITAAAPNKRSLGTTNGISQTSASITRIIAPAFATSLFSFCVEHNILGGYVIYLVLFVLSCFGILLALRVPVNMRPVWEEEDGGIPMSQVAYVPLEMEPIHGRDSIEYSM